MSSVSVPAGGKGVLRRPSALTGVWSWFTTVDHKKIGLMYGASSFCFFLVGGLEALVIRAQLAQPNGHVVTAQVYNEIFTMHGLTMIFLFVMPMSAAFFNYLIPLMIGARDVAFPRLNAFSFWVFILGGLFLYSSWFMGGAPDGGWFGYAPNSVVDPGPGMTFYALGLIITGIASSAGAINLAVTVINMRAPGMTLFRMPVFVWMGLVVQFLLAFSLPIITVDLFELLFDRRWHTNFFNTAAGGDPVLWQHLFWLFGHPEVYVLILPAFGIISEIIPVFARKPLFGYQFVVFSGISIGFIGFGVWAHHMFAVGLGPVANTAFGISTAIIAIPTGVKIFNWMATMAGGDLKFDAPMLFAIGTVAMFVIGGLSGVTHSIVPSDYQQTDTYYVVAHFHYVLFGGAVFGLFGGMYYWWPKVFGHQLSELLGKIQFWVMLVGFNLTFGPMHVLGLNGMIRREYTYPASLGLTFWNQVASTGSAVIAIAIVIFIVNVVRTQIRKRPLTTTDPWDARTIEWITSCPPPVHNFDEIPTVHALGRVLAPQVRGGRKDRGAGAGAGRRGARSRSRARGAGGHAIHLPSPSFWPLVAAVGLPIIAYGIMYSWFLVGGGAIVTLVGFYGWALEPSVAEG